MTAPIRAREALAAVHGRVILGTAAFGVLAMVAVGVGLVPLWPNLARAHFTDIDETLRHVAEIIAVSPADPQNLAALPFPEEVQLRLIHRGLICALFTIAGVGLVTAFYAGETLLATTRLRHLPGETGAALIAGATAGSLCLRFLLLDALFHGSRFISMFWPSLLGIVLAEESDAVGGFGPVSLAYPVTLLALEIVLIAGRLIFSRHLWKRAERLAPQEFRALLGIA
jgi:hypothetical protein